MEFKVNDNFKVINGSNLDVLDTIADESIDAIITDPPYELGFMGKKWDSTGIAYNVELWKKALRVLKRGGYLLAFGGSRTFHRVACAIEDAGFEIRDTIMWLYGSGFPKSMNIGFAVDKINGVESKVIGKQKYSCPISADLYNVGETTLNRRTTTDIKQAQNEWAGWGTQLKPAFEPIIMARKPTNLTIAQNCLAYGVGGINIDECRVGDEEITYKPTDLTQAHGNSLGKAGTHTPKMKDADDISHFGRFPANIITDGSDEVASGMQFDDDNSAMRYYYCAKASKKDRDNGLDMFDEKSPMEQTGRKEHSLGLEYIDENGKLHQNPYAGTKSSKKNIHPTVKPVELMQYLVRLVCPKGALIMDIFNGSGSTGKAVAFENRERNANYSYIGIELQKEYCEISVARIDYALNKYEYDMIQDIKKEEQETGQLSLFDF